MLVLAQRLANLIAAPVCLLCHGDGQSLDELWGLDLCQFCEQACALVPTTCPRCGERAEKPMECATCRVHPPPYDAAFCLFAYQDPADLLVTSLKFRHELAAARVLGTLFARHCIAAGRALPQCLIPVPLHATRYRERGFNQSMEIARHMAPRLRNAGRQLAIRGDLLQRVRATDAQSELDAAGRAANLAGAFRARGRNMPQHVALLDDVMTTGHTAAAAALALKAGGCQRVEIWACARALREPRPRSGAD
jgi:ComF family protein